MKQNDFSEELYPLDSSDRETLEGYRAGMWAYSNHDELFSVSSNEFAQGIADWWGLPVQVVIDDLRDGQTSGRSLIALTAIHGSPRKPSVEEYSRRKHNA